MSSPHFKIRVVGEGKVRASGTLAFVVPQALDLVDRSTYVVSIIPANAKGVFRIRKVDDQIIGVWSPNPNLQSNTSSDAPSWCADAIRMSHELGKRITRV